MKDNMVPEYIIQYKDQHGNWFNATRSSIIYFDQAKDLLHRYKETKPSFAHTEYRIVKIQGSDKVVVYPPEEVAKNKTQTNNQSPSMFNKQTNPVMTARAAYELSNPVNVEKELENLNTKIKEAAKLGKTGLTMYGGIWSAPKNPKWATIASQLRELGYEVGVTTVNVPTAKYGTNIDWYEAP